MIWEDWFALIAASSVRSDTVTHYQMFTSVHMSQRSTMLSSIKSQELYKFDIC